jgi:hypothetical protein
MVPVIGCRVCALDAPSCVQVDLLSHIAIRARNSGVLLASCADASVWDGLVAEHAGEYAVVAASPGSGDVTITPSSSSAAAAGGTSNAGAATPPRLRRPDATNAWALTSAEFKEGLVGGKSLGIKRLADLARGSAGFEVPAAFAVPYGVFDRTLAAAPASLQDRFRAAVDVLNSTASGRGDLDMVAVRGALAEVRDTVSALPLPEALRAAVATAASGQGGTVAAWAAIEDDSSEVRSVPCQRGVIFAWARDLASDPFSASSRAWTPWRPRGAAQRCSIKRSLGCPGTAPAHVARLPSAALHSVGLTCMVVPRVHVLVQLLTCTAWCTLRR